MQTLVKQLTAALKNKTAEPWFLWQRFIHDILYMSCLVLAWCHGNSQVPGLNWLPLLHINKTHSADISPIWQDCAHTVTVHPLPNSQQAQLHRETSFLCHKDTRINDNFSDFMEWSAESKRTLWFAGKKVQNATRLILYYDWHNFNSLQVQVFKCRAATGSNVINNSGVVVANNTVNQEDTSNKTT